MEMSGRAEKKTSKPAEPALFAVQETREGFEVKMPTARFGSHLAVGVERFKTREEAQEAAEQGREASRLFWEQRSLAKSFTPHFERIDQTPDGRFRVTLPGLVESSTGRFMGTTTVDFDSWDEAKKEFLGFRERRERLAEKPLLELTLDAGQKIAFSALDAFDPYIAPSDRSLPIPAAVEKHIAQQTKVIGDDSSAGTYQETLKRPEWKRELWSFVRTYAESGPVAKELGIDDVELLSPKQAVELATRIVVEHTKYKWSDTENRAGEKTKADQSTALELLKAGSERKEDPAWEGNGICRNFASTVKAVFEAIKENQTRFHRLRDTYCLYETGKTAYAPTRKSVFGNDVKFTGHAWNTFVTLSREGHANAVSVDATWAKQNLATGQVEGLDYTLTRMEPMVHDIVQGLPPAAPDREEQVNHALSYYQLKMERATGVRGMSSPTEERWFFASRALEILSKNPPERIMPSLLASIGDECLAHAGELDRAEIETLHALSRKSSRVPMREILRQYLRGRELTEHKSRQLVFSNVGLQREVFEQLQLDGRAETLLRDSPTFRARMRELLPQLLPEFRPETRAEDERELAHAIASSRYLSDRFSYVSVPGHWKKEGALAAFYAKARDMLSRANPQRFETLSGSLSDEQVVRRFDALMEEMRRP